MEMIKEQILKMDDCRRQRKEVMQHSNFVTAQVEQWFFN